MNANNYNNEDLLDILFKGKNKAYGAYELRKNYNKRITTAVISTVVLCILFFLTQIFANKDGRINNRIVATEIILKGLEKPKEEIPEPPKVKPVKTTPLKVAVTRYTEPLIVKNDEVTDPPPATDQLEHTRIGLMDQDGVKDAELVAPPVERSTGEVGNIKKDDEDYTKVFTKVEKEATFPGGLAGWKKYLERNLNSNIAADEGAPAGNYTVKVEFIVDAEGGISNVEAVDVPKACPGCGIEAVKVIKKGPKWEPAVQNDRKVAYHAVQFVTFQVLEE